MDRLMRKLGRLAALAAVWALLPGGCRTAGGPAGRVPRIEVPPVGAESRPLEKLDALFAGEQAGRTVRFDLVMRDVSVRRVVRCPGLAVEAGSVTFSSKEGHLRFLPGGRVSARPSAGAEERPMSFIAGTPANVSVWCIRGVDGTFTSLSVTGIDPPRIGGPLAETYANQPLAHTAAGATVTVRVEVGFSADFRGRLAGWQVAAVN